MSTHLDKALIQPIDSLEGLRIRERQDIRPETNDLAILLVKLEVSDVWPLLVNIIKPPPVRQGSQERARVLVQPIVVSVPDEPGEDDGEYHYCPVLGQQLYYLVKDHIAMLRVYMCVCVCLCVCARGVSVP